MRTALSKIALGLLGLALITGCTTSTPGFAEPAPASSVAESPDPSDSPSSEPSDGPSDGAPDVEDPIDVSEYQQDPCQVFTAAQLQELAVEPTGEPTEEESGNSCRWRHPDQRGSVHLFFLDANGRGLGGIYAAKSRGDLAFFEELPLIDGFPALTYGQIDDRANGGCAVAIGVNNKVAFTVYLIQSAANVGQRDPCDAAAQVAGMALETMKTT